MSYEAYHDNSEWWQLSRWEIETAWFVGKRMREESLRDGRRETHGWERLAGPQGTRDQCLGMLCEQTAGKALDIYWEPLINHGRRADFERHNIEVRLIGVDWYGLRVRPHDNDYRRVVGVVIEKGKEREPYRMPGWCYAWEAKYPQFSIAPHDRPPVFAMPQQLLHPLSCLRNLITSERIWRKLELTT